jgi:predicted ATPase/DNA-binding winged helix-turn-helix (wHTH) protein
MTGVEGPRSVQFGDVVVHLARREVERGGEPVHLEPQAFDVLQLLLHERDRVVPKAELLERVWGDQFVSESALTTRIKEVRRAVGDDGKRQAVIRNVRGRGYRFVAEPTAARLPAGQTARWPGTGAVAPAAADLFGREGELAAVRELLGSAPVVTLVGPGGVGKTALAAALAAEAAGARNDGAIVVRLAAVADADAVGPAIRRAAGIRGAASDHDLVRTLSSLDALLVLDNCEHVVVDVARVAQALAAAIRQDGSPLRLLVTSRERLGIAGEQVVPVDVLTGDAARRLFLARANAAQPGFELRTDDADDLERLLEMLDHLPLAIEMAAARVPALALPDLSSLIGERFDVLESPDRAGEARHRDLGALVAWSVDLLDETTRSTLADFSVFAGTVTAEDVTAVLGAHRVGSAMVDVARLVDRSLIVADTRSTPSRYRMLETIRAHVSASRSGAAARRHAEWFAELADHADRDLRTPHEAEADQRLGAAHRWARAEAPELAARISRALDLFAHSRHWPEPAGWAAALAPVLGDDDPGAPGVWAALAAEAAHQGDYGRAEELGRRVLAGGDVRATISALESLSDVATYGGALATARGYGVELRTLGEQHDDLHAYSVGATSVVLSHVYGGEVDLALTLLEGISRSGLAPGDRAWIAYAEAEALGAVDPEAAIERFELAIELGTAVDSTFVAGVSTVSMLSLQARTGDPAAALGRFGPVLAGYRRTGDVTHSATALRNLIDLLVRIGDDEVAMSILGALAADSPKSSFGEEADRLDLARRTVEERAGATQAERWMARGAGRGPSWALDRAIEHLAVDDAATAVTTGASDPPPR